jgi:hypothetical protein
MSEHDIHECLSGLIEAAAEAEVAFHSGASDVRSEEARLLLLDRAQRYGRTAGRLRELAAARGRPHTPLLPEQSPRIAPAEEAHVLDAAEQRESDVAVAFRDALERPLPSEVRAVVAAEFETLLGSLGSLAAVRDRAARQRRFVVGTAV